MVKEYQCDFFSIEAEPKPSVFERAKVTLRMYDDEEEVAHILVVHSGAELMTILFQMYAAAQSVFGGDGSILKFKDKVLEIPTIKPGGMQLPSDPGTGEFKIGDWNDKQVRQGETPGVEGS